MRFRHPSLKTVAFILALLLGSSSVFSRPARAATDTIFPLCRALLVDFRTEPDQVLVQNTLYHLLTQSYPLLYNERPNTLMRSALASAFKDSPLKLPLDELAKKIIATRGHHREKLEAISAQLWQTIHDDFATQDILTLMNLYPHIRPEHFDDLITLVKVIENEPKLKRAVTVLLEDLTLNGETWIPLVGVDNYLYTSEKTQSTQYVLYNQQVLAHDVRKVYAAKQIAERENDFRTRTTWMPAPKAILPIPLEAKPLTTAISAARPLGKQLDFSGIRSLLEFSEKETALVEELDFFRFGASVGEGVVHLNAATVKFAEGLRTQEKWGPLFANVDAWITMAKASSLDLISISNYKLRVVQIRRSVLLEIDHLSRVVAEGKSLAATGLETLNRQAQILKDARSENQTASSAFFNRSAEIEKILQKNALHQSELSALIEFVKKWEDAALQSKKLLASLDSEILQVTSTPKNIDAIKETMRTLHQTLQLDPEWIKPFKKGFFK